jgi:RNA polymerase sigma factor (TIGR02999 family)
MSQNDDAKGGEDLAEAYSALRSTASRYLRSVEPVTLQTTSLVHEAYLKLAARSSVTLRGAGHARALMARAMRQVLIDHVRRRHTEKHGPPSVRIGLEHVEIAAPPLEVEDVLRGLDRLERDDPASARLLELAYFGGYGQREIGEILGVSDRTVRTRLVAAQASLARVLGGGDEGSS